MPFQRITQPLLRFKFEVRSLLAREPALKQLYQPFIWWAMHKAVGHIDPSECTVSPDTELVIDGFQGSGNSFATVAFKSSQTRPVRLAHHLHSPAQIIEAVGAGRPVLVTVREPRDAVVSLVSRWPYLSLRQAIRGYTHFYEKILPVAPSCVVSTFEATTRHLDLVIEEVNARFGRNFDVFRHTEESVRALRNPEVLESETESKRKDMKRRMKAALDEPVYESLLRHAESVYHGMAAFGLAVPADGSSASAGP